MSDFKLNYLMLGKLTFNNKILPPVEDTLINFMDQLQDIDNEYCKEFPCGV